MNQKTLILNGLTKSFKGLTAVKNLTLSVEAGEICAFIGPNGAGKTTTVRMILDLIQADSGNIEILGGPFEDKKRDLIGYLPEERGFYRSDSLREAVLYFAQLKGLSRKEAKIKVCKFFKVFDLTEHQDKIISKLSRGMQQKAQLIAAIINSPKLLIVDEPFAALDPVNTKLTKQILLSLAKEGTSILLCTHQMHLVEELACKVAMLNKGELVLSGSPEGIRKKYATGNAIVIGEGELKSVPGKLNVEPLELKGSYLVRGISNTEAKKNLESINQQQNFTLHSYELERPSLEDIFIKQVSSVNLNLSN